MHALRVVCLNIWNRSGPWDARLPLIRAGLRAEAADIVALQEVLCMSGPAGDLSQLDDIVRPDGEDANPLYAHRAYAPAWTLDAAAGFTMGNAILSRFPILETHTVLLPNPIGHETRSLLCALLQTGAGLQPILVTHLDWQFNLSHARCQQVSFMVDCMDGWLRAARDRNPGADLLPAILCGDFNAESDSDEIRFLRGRHALPAPGTGVLRGVYFNDPVDFCHADAGPTFARDNVFAAREREPDRRVDYIFVAPPDRLGRGVPLAVRRCFTQPKDGVFASDHYGVVADIAWRAATET